MPVVLIISATQDVALVLQRHGSDDRQWRMIYRIDQRWVKNNRDPSNVQ
jgi:hypothetical protein